MIKLDNSNFLLGEALSILTPLSYETKYLSPPLTEPIINLYGDLESLLTPDYILWFLTIKNKMSTDIMILQSISASYEPILMIFNGRVESSPSIAHISARIRARCTNVVQL